MAGLDGGPGGRAVLLGGLAAEEPSIGVEPDAVPQLAAQQVVDRQAQGLPLDIPKGHVHAAKGHRRQAPRSQVGEAPIVLLPQALALKRVLPYQALAQQLDGSGAQEAAAPGRVAGFAPAVDAFIGVDAHEGPVPLEGAGVVRVPGLDHVSLDVGDFHGLCPPEWVKRRRLGIERGARLRVWKARAVLPKSGANGPCACLWPSAGPGPEPEAGRTGRDRNGQIPRHTASHSSNRTCLH